MYNNSIGIIFDLARLLNEGAESISEIGIDSVQLCCWSQELLTEENAEKAVRLLDGRVRITSFWAG